MNPGNPPLTSTPSVTVAGYLAALDAQITTRRSISDRAWAWAFVTHALAVAEITDTALQDRSEVDGTEGRASGPGSTAAVWVSPHMSWAMDDLVDAGVRTTSPDLPSVDISSRPDVIAGALRRLIITADLTDESAPPLLREAVRAAGRRAVLAHEAYAGPLP